MNKKPLIFIVEDNPIYNRLLEGALKSDGHINVECFFNGEDALVALANKKPDIIIQDYLLLGGMNGIEMLKATKKIAPKTEFIFISGNDNIEIAIETIKCGAYDYMVKSPETLKELGKTIEKVLVYKKIATRKLNFKIGIILFFGALIIFLILIVALVLSNPEYYGWNFRKALSI